MLESGGTVKQVTMQWDASTQSTKELRSKEQAHDYRYFPEPDLGYILVTQDMLHDATMLLPELPLAMKQRLSHDYGIPYYDAGILTEDKSLANFLRKLVCNYL